jgi:hypothetical protein
MSTKSELELARAKHRINELEHVLGKLQQKQGQHRAELIGNVQGDTTDTCWSSSMTGANGNGDIGRTKCT